MDRLSQPAASGRNADAGAWRYLLHTKAYRYRALLRKYWWLVLFTTAAGLAFGAWKTASQKIVFVSTGKLMVSGKINISESAVYSEEMNLFLTTQREMMQDEAVRQRAEKRVATQYPETPASPVFLTAAPVPQTTIFLLTATGDEPLYPQRFLDAVMTEYINTRHEMRAEKSESTETALTTEIEQEQTELDKAEQKLRDFQKNKNLGFLSKEQNSAAEYLAKLSTQLADLKKEAALLELFDTDQDAARKLDHQAESISRGDLRDSHQTPQTQYLEAKHNLEMVKAQYSERSKELKPKHPIMIELTQQIDQQQHLLDTYKKQSADDLQRRREASKLEIQNLEKTIKEWEGKALSVAEQLGEYDRIQAEITRRRSQVDSLTHSKGTINVAHNIDQDVVSVRQRASPAAAQKPVPVKTLATSIILGLVSGLLFLVLIDQIDDRVASFTEFQVHFPDRVLSQIPSVPRKAGASGTVKPLTSDDERHAFNEAFRSLRSSLIFLPLEGPAPKVFLVTSAVPNEGKSTVTVNLAITLASSGARVLLVDGDLRRGEIHHTLQVKNDRGFTDVLQGSIDLETAVQATAYPTLWLLSRGSAVSTPGELYLAKETDRFLQKAHDAYDYVILDSSPVMAADDTTSVAPKADATLFVFRFTSSNSRISRKALALLRERQANVIGVICNDVSEAMQEYYYHRYPQYYSPAAAAAAGSKPAQT